MAKRVIGVDIGGGEIKIGEFFVHNDTLELANMGVRPLGIEPGEEADPAPFILNALRECLGENDIQSSSTAISIAGQSAFVRPVKLPPVKPDKIFQTVRYEAEQNVPFPINEVVWDYQFMRSSGEEGDLNVLLVAIKADIIERMTDSVESAGLDIDVVDVAPMALYNAFRYNYGALDGCTLLIDIGARSTNLVFMEGDRFFSRTLPIVGTGNAISQQLMKEFQIDFAAAEKLKRENSSVGFGGSYEDYEDKVLSNVSKTVRSAMTRLHVEIERTINFYRNQQGGERPDRAFLAGGTSIIPRTEAFFREKLKIDVEMLNPFRNIAIGRKVDKDVLDRHAHAMGEVVGAALRLALPCPIEINLLPKTILAEKDFKRKQPLLALTGFCAILVALSWWLYFSRISLVTNERAEKVQARVSEIERIDGRLRAMEAEESRIRAGADDLARLIAGRTQWIEVLSEVQARVLDGMWITSFIPLTEADETKGAGAAAAAGTRRIQRGGARTPAAGAEKPGEARTYTQIEIKGRIFADKANDSSILMFCENLKESPLFDESTDITLAPLPDKGDFFREFTIRAALVEPIK